MYDIIYNHEIQSTHEDDGLQNVVAGLRNWGRCCDDGETSDKVQKSKRDTDGPVGGRHRSDNRHQTKQWNFRRNGVDRDVPGKRHWGMGKGPGRCGTCLHIV